MKITVQQMCSSMALILVCVSMFASLGLAADLPSPPEPKTTEGSLPVVGVLPPGAFSDISECWSSLQSIKGCVDEIYQSFFSGQIRPLGPACCKAIVEVNEGCWPKMFPFNPFFPPFIKSYCAISTGGAAASPPKRTPTVGSMFASLRLAANLPSPPELKTDEGSLPVVGILPLEAFSDISLCWSSLQSIKGCVDEIYQSFSSGQIRPLGPACCKAIVEINEGCWPKMFPFNPFFPPLIKSYCAISHGGAAAVTPPPHTSTTTTTVKKTV